MTRRLVILAVVVFILAPAAMGYAIPNATVTDVSIGDGGLITGVDNNDGDMEVRFHADENISKVNFIKPSGELYDSQQVETGERSVSVWMNAFEVLPIEAGEWTIVLVSGDGRVLDTATVTVEHERWSL